MLHAPASGRGAQWSACIKTMSVCLTRKIIAFFDAWGVVSNQYPTPKQQRFFPRCRLSCKFDRPAVEGWYALRMLPQAGHTQVDSMQTKMASHDLVPLLERHACHHVSLSRSPRVPEERNMLIPSFCSIIWRVQKPSLLAEVQSS